MRKKIVFAGSHLSVKRGTKGISEKIAGLLDEEYNITLVSCYENLALRLLDIVFTLIFKRFDIVHVDVFSNRGFIYANMASRVAKIKNEMLVMTLRGGMLVEKYKQEPKRLRTVFSRADVLQSPSLFLIDFFKKQGIAVEYMPNFVNLDYFPYSRGNVQPFSLLWVRAFSPEYQPELAIETLQKVLKQYPDATLTMVGPDKGVQKSIEQLLEELGLSDRVSFKGKVPNENLYTYYQSHEVYLNTTAYESFGVAVIEAASCGIPVVSTKVGEIPYLWRNEEDILMVEDFSSAHMADKVMQLFEDKDLAMKLSVNARKKAESFDWVNVKPLWLKLLKEGV